MTLVLRYNAGRSLQESIYKFILFTVISSNVISFFLITASCFHYCVSAVHWSCLIMSVHLLYFTFFLRKPIRHIFQRFILFQILAICKTSGPLILGAVNRINLPINHKMYFQLHFECLNPIGLEGVAKSSSLRFFLHFSQQSLEMLKQKFTYIVSHPMCT